MKSFFARSFCVALGLLGLVPLSAAEPFGSASLLPMPSADAYQPASPLIAPASYGNFQEEISPSDQAQPFTPPPAPPLSQDYQNAMKQAWDGAGSCGEMPAPCGRPCPKFAIWGSALLMGRGDYCNRPLTLQGGTFQNAMGTHDAAEQWAGGFEVGGAWIMPNCCNAISFNYWGLFPSSEMAYRNADSYDPNGIRPVLANIDRLDYDDGTNTDDVFQWMSTDDGRHQITQQSTFHSVEVNFLGNTQAWGLVPYGAGCGSCNGCNPCGSCCAPRWQFGWLAGLRYFNFHDQFLFETDYDDAMIGDPGDVNELRYAIDANNSLLGFQFGGQGAWYWCDCFSIYGGGRFGVYNNYVTATQYIAGEGGDAYHNSGALSGNAYRYTYTDNVLAGVGQFDLGARYQLGCHWSFYGGYRVVGISGVATGASQINENWANRPYICANDSVLLHGTYLGAQFAW